jgi:flagellar protein FlaI
MTNVALPVSEPNLKDSGSSDVQRNLYDVLPEPLKEVCGQNHHLLEYLNGLPIAKIGVPQYVSQLSRQMAANKEPNIIYPVNSNGIFVHILFDEKGDRHHYIPIEPTTTLNLGELMEQVEDACIGVSEKIPGIDPDVDREPRLLAYLDQVTTLDDLPRPGLADKVKGFRRHNDDSKPIKIRVTSRELEGIKYLFIRDKVRMGILEPLILDPYIEDISCSGMGNVFIEHKIFKSLKSTIIFSTFEELDDFVLRLAEQVRKPVTYKNPIADATLPDGSRINIVYGRDISKRGSNFSIRKFSETPLSIFDIVDFGTINYQMLAYLSLAIGNGMNVFVAGESASGKTALLNALTAFISPVAKVVTIEDTPELQVPQKNWIREVVQTTKSDDTSGAVTMFDLLRAALRQRPNEILVGEIRGREGNIAFQAMQTGHSVMATFHAASIEKLIQRITGDPISVPKTYIDNLNIAVLMGMVKLPNGKVGRRVTSIAEIVGWDSSSQTFNIAEAFKYNEATDSFMFTGHMASYILEFKIAPMLGIPGHKKQRIYDQVERRANILAKLHKEMGVTGFYEILEVLSKAQKDGLF